MKLITLGLGNPGEEYEGTRHNTGRMLVDVLAKKMKSADWSFDAKTKTWASVYKDKKNEIIFLKPDTFMNKSGAAVSSVISSPKKAETLIVIHDDLDLPIGTIKMSWNRGSGGHRGVESVKRAVKTEGFSRLRIGISKAAAKGGVKKPQGEKDVGDFILGKFKPLEEKALLLASKKIFSVVETFLERGRDQAIAVANTR